MIGLWDTLFAWRKILRSASLHCVNLGSQNDWRTKCLHSHFGTKKGPGRHFKQATSAADVPVLLRLYAYVPQSFASFNCLNMFKPFHGLSQWMLSLVQSRAWPKTKMKTNNTREQNNPWKTLVLNLSLVICWTFCAWVGFINSTFKEGPTVTGTQILSVQEIQKSTQRTSECIVSCYY